MNHRAKRLLKEQEKRDSIERDIKKKKKNRRSENKNRR
jgi:hypothetical protein